MTISYYSFIKVDAKYFCEDIFEADYFEDNDLPIEDLDQVDEGFEHNDLSCLTNEWQSDEVSFILYFTKVLIQKQILNEFEDISTRGPWQHFSIMSFSFQK